MRNLSFGDRACLAWSKELSLLALTADKAWKQVGDDAGLQVELLQ
jgi:PIN domain nuclease of toxin-antitoxin system